MQEYQAEFSFTQEDFNVLKDKVQNYAGIQVSNEKFEMFYARLVKRLRHLKLESFAQYVTLVQQDESEFKHLINAITTNVTSFGREQHHFEFLKRYVQQYTKPSLSIWSAGCSTGQEPYSLLIELFDICASKGITLKILATDLDSDVLHTARQGIYSIELIDRYSPIQRKAFFNKGVGNQSGQCRIKPIYQQHFTFAQLNLIEPWVLDNSFDVIFCRNVIIYFGMEQKTSLLQRFHQHLKQDGLLFVGHSETLTNASGRFENIGKTIYQKIENNNA